jgi:hypothetical protein
MYFWEEIVGASCFSVMLNSAPSAPYVIEVPSAYAQSELLPFVKSVVRVVPNAGSAGQAVDCQLSSCFREMRCLHFLVGSQLVKVCACTKESADRSTVVVDVVKRILLLGRLCCVWVGKEEDGYQE